MASSCGGIGLALVVIYLVAYYRGLAFIALLSLLVSGILTYTIMSLLGPAIGFALNLLRRSAAPSSRSASQRTRSSCTSNE